MKYWCVAKSRINAEDQAAFHLTRQDFKVLLQGKGCGNIGSAFQPGFRDNHPQGKTADNSVADRKMICQRFY